MLGMRGYSTCEIVMNDCQVPKANLLGNHGEGRKVALSSLAKGRVTIAAQCCGWGRSLRSPASHRRRRTPPRGATNSDANGQAHILGEMAVAIEAARDKSS